MHAHDTNTHTHMMRVRVHVRVRVREHESWLGSCWSSNLHPRLGGAGGEEGARARNATRALWAFIQSMASTCTLNT